MSTSEKGISEIDTGKFKHIFASRHANYHDFRIAQEAVRRYIQTRGRILYGGIAIDYALRLRGDQIYADSDIPDFDFWSPTPIEDAREILDILGALLPEANIWGSRAKFIRTMRVFTIGPNYWAADISYVPPDIFAKIPTLIFDGMRIVHPHLQISDIHSGLAFPYDGAPFEVVFARWKKDIERFNQIFAAYPLMLEPDIASPRPETTQVAISRELAAHSILHGFAAYSLYYNLIAKHPKARALVGDNLPFARPPKMLGANEVLIDVPFDLVEIVAHRDIIKDHTSAKNPRRFAPLLDIFEASSMASLERATLIAYSSRGRLVGYQAFQLAGDHAKIRAVSIQGLLKYFIAGYSRAKYFSHTVNGPIIESNVYLAYYLACLKMIEVSRDVSCRECADLRAYFEPSLNVFGETAPPLHDLLSLRNDIAKILAARHEPPLSDDIPLPPRNIRALRSDESAPKPFNYASCPFMLMSGEEISSPS